MDASADRSLRNPSRRRLLQVGVAGAVVLALVPLFTREQKRVARGFQHLREPDLDLWHALIPALLAGLLPTEAVPRDAVVEKILKRIDGSLALMQPSVRAQVLKLYDFVEMAPARGLTSGFWGDWSAATPDDARRVLESWSKSRLRLLRGSFQALRSFASGGWAGLPEAWAVTGYPGPPSLGGAAP